MLDPQLAIAVATVAWVGPQITSLSLVTHAIDRGMMAHPQYPANPVTDCPKLVLRIYKGDIVGRPNLGIDWDYAMSYWLYRRQTPGQNHQQLLLADLQTLENLFLGNFGPMAIRNAGADFIAPVQSVVHDELNHPLGEPRLRVSVGELVLGVKAHIN